MAFMQAPTSSGSGSDGDRLPILSYNAKAGRLFLQDRSQAADGTWETTKTDVTMTQPAFAVDFRSLEVGYMFFAAGAAPIFLMAPMGAEMPAKPPSPGKDTDGKVLQFKQGFRVKVIGREIGGTRELAGNAATSIEGLNALHTEYEAAPEAAAGKIPLVKMTNVIPIKVGQSENYQPVFTIQGWVDRPDVLGPATVAVPGGGFPVQTAPARTAPVATPPAHVAAAAMAPKPQAGGMPNF